MGLLDFLQGTLGIGGGPDINQTIAGGGITPGGFSAGMGQMMPPEYMQGQQQQQMQSMMRRMMLSAVLSQVANRNNPRAGNPMAQMMPMMMQMMRMQQEAPILQARAQREKQQEELLRLKTKGAEREQATYDAMSPEDLQKATRVKMKLDLSPSEEAHVQLARDMAKARQDYENRMMKLRGREVEDREAAQAGAAARGERKAEAADWQVMRDDTGKVIRINKRTGQVIEEGTPLSPKPGKGEKLVPVKETAPDTGETITTYKPESEVKGKSFRTAPKVSEKAQSEIEDLTNSKDLLGQIKETYYRGGGKQWVGGFRGGVVGRAGETVPVTSTDEQTFRSQVQMELAATLHRLYASRITPTDLSLGSFMPRMDQSPQKFEANLKVMEDNLNSLLKMKAGRGGGRTVPMSGHDTRIKKFNLKTGNWEEEE